MLAVVGEGPDMHKSSGVLDFTTFVPPADGDLYGEIFLCAPYQDTAVLPSGECYGNTTPMVCVPGRLLDVYFVQRNSATYPVDTSAEGFRIVPGDGTYNFMFSDNTERFDTLTAVGAAGPAEPTVFTLLTGTPATSSGVLAGGELLWFKWVAENAVPAPATFSTENSVFDTTLTLYMANGDGTLTQVDFNDDGIGSQSLITRGVVAGEVYFMKLAGFSPESAGDYVMTVTV